ncbi:MAG: SUMF1/EgtB/PvdO family nonheme iron enzyme [Planctomycetota bacterium]|nr:SUMF1/EgtB/PvdO family nonheme iron enzyme [Planctomycetota bacterium]MDA1161553.1 SUMF1/EgtB/PvdO family nonheme iron enzyme [Planctomycetota bacterium]
MTVHANLAASICRLLVVLFFGSVQPSTAADSVAEKPAMKPYVETLSGVDVSFDMVPIPGGEFMLGSPSTEANRKDDEGPQVKVKIEPFWMGKYEVTWDEYDIWSFRLDIQRRNIAGAEPTKLDAVADAVTRPTPPYTDMTFGMGHDGYPAICMTQHAAKMYCRWLSEKTGHFYRLPTEAEWEYACRAGKTTAYSFGDSPDDLGDFGWYYDNSDEQYHKTGLKKPNPWGLYDMHGNVSEWVLDRYDPEWYSDIASRGAAKSPLNVPTDMYPRIVRGGSWDDDADGLRSASRYASDPEWKFQDPQIPKSIWYHTDALHVGFRIVRPLKPPTPEERVKLKLDPEQEIAKQGRAG